MASPSLGLSLHICKIPHERQVCLANKSLSKMKPTLCQIYVQRCLKELYRHQKNIIAEFITVIRKYLNDFCLKLANGFNRSLRFRQPVWKLGYRWLYLPQNVMRLYDMSHNRNLTLWLAYNMYLINLSCFYTHFVNPYPLFTPSLCNTFFS